MPVVITGAAKREQKQEQAAASVTVVTQDEIELYGYRDLADILRAQRSFYIHNDGLYSFLGVRGFMRPGEWNARILVLVDGRPTREPIFGQTNLDMDTVVPVELMKRVEIIRGPGSALYGSNAVFAVINVITRDGADVRNWLELKGQVGTEDTGRGVAIVGRKLDNGLDFIAGGSRFGTSGDEDIHYPGVHDADHNFGHIRDNDDQDSGSGFFKSRYKDFTLEADFNRRTVDNRAATYLASWFNPGSMTERNDSVSVAWDRKVDSDRSAHGLLFFSQYRYNQHWGLDQEDPVTYTSTAKSDWLGSDFHYNWQTSEKNQLIVGTEAMQTLRAIQKDYDTESGTVLDVDPSASWWALYVQDEYQLTEKVSLVGGARLDWLQRFGPLVNPRAGVIYSPQASDTFKFLYGRAFRAPNLYEMYYASPGSNVPNRNIDPEINDTFEVVWGHDFKNGWHSELDYYFWRMGNSLGDTATADGELQTKNIGTSWAQGLEGELTKKWSNGARVRLNASIGRAVAPDDERAEQSPDIVTAAAFILPVYKRTFLAFENQIVGPQLSDTRDSSNTSYLTNVVLTSRNVWKGMDVQLGFYNLLGQDARIPHNSVWDHTQPWLVFPDPTVLLSLTYRF